MTATKKKAGGQIKKRREIVFKNMYTNMYAKQYDKCFWV